MATYATLIGCRLAAGFAAKVAAAEAPTTDFAVKPAAAVEAAGLAAAVAGADEGTALGAAAC